jgi:hypothetical protein
MFLLESRCEAKNVRKIARTDQFRQELRQEAKFLVPDWGMKLAMASGRRTGPQSYIGWRAGTTA